MRIFHLFFALAVCACLQAQTPAELRNKLPDIPGWTIDRTVETFDPNTLFERINGAAEGYFLFDFKELTVFVYNKAGEGGGEEAPYITLQIYRHGTPVDAFGIYASERPLETSFIPVGAEGYQEGSLLNFWTDYLYIKIESPSSTPDVEKTIAQIARQLGQNLGSDAKMPALFEVFPAPNKIAHSEQYIPKSFLGHDFLNNAYSVGYQVSGKKYQVFVMDAGSAEGAQNLLTRYFQFTKQTSKIREGRITIKDRYNGDLECQWKGRYIWGILNDNNAAVKADEVLKEIGKNLAI